MRVTRHFPLLVLAIVAWMLLAAPKPASAQAPAAGTTIGNQATATYKDGSGATRSVTSNVVTTVVQQVASLTLTQDNTRYATVGNIVYFPHLLTNTGNGADTYTMTVTQPSGTDGYDLANVKMYYDANNNGVIDPGDTEITTTTPSIAAGGTASIIVQGTVPTGSTGNAVLTLKAESVFGGATVNATNDDTATAPRPVSP